MTKEILIAEIKASIQQTRIARLSGNLMLAIDIFGRMARAGEITDADYACDGNMLDAWGMFGGQEFRLFIVAENLRHEEMHAANEAFVETELPICAECGCTH